MQGLHASCCADERVLLGGTRPLEERGFDLGLGTGVAQGYATIGAVGFEGRWDYGAIGTVTNLAARLCGEARSGQILISPRVLGAIDDQVDAEPVGELILKGFAKPLPAYVALGSRPGSPDGPPAPREPACSTRPDRAIPGVVHGVDKVHARRLASEEREEAPRARPAMAHLISAGRPC